MLRPRPRVRKTLASLLLALYGGAACGASNREIRRAAAESLPCATDHASVTRISEDQAFVECQQQGVHVIKRDGAWEVVDGPHTTTDRHERDEEGAEAEER